MRPDDLVEFSRQTYRRSLSVNIRDSDQLNSIGLNPAEKTWLEHVPAKGGRLLLLGVGAGREVAPLAERNYEITAVDFVGELLERARESAAMKGLQLHVLEQEISKLEVPSEYFDVVWLSAGMYSCVPTSGRRVEMAKRIWKCLKPGGHFLFGFVLSAPSKPRTVPRMLRTAFAYVTFGNLTYEPGDTLWRNSEFIHLFASGEEIRAELNQAGFDAVMIDTDYWGGAVFRKAEKRADSKDGTRSTE